MGKIRTRFIGDESVEDEQKKDQKERAKRKKMEKILGENPEISEELTEKSEKTASEAETKTPVASEQKIIKKAPRKRGKNYTGAKKKLDIEKMYEIAEAVDAIKKVAFAKFPESVELHLNLLKDGLKGEVELPYSTGKTVKVAIVDDAVIEKLEQGVIDFDILITHPSYMPRIAKFARTLGPKGLMPNPKSGTVSTTPEEVAKKFEKGTLRWKSESKAPLIHQLVAKLTASTDEITANVITFIQSVGKKNIKIAYIKSTMSPAIKINLEGIE